MPDSNLSFHHLYLAMPEFPETIDIPKVILGTHTSRKLKKAPEKQFELRWTTKTPTNLGS
jgi:hypothetical protein